MNDMAEMMSTSSQSRLCASTIPPNKTKLHDCSLKTSHEKLIDQCSLFTQFLCTQGSVAIQTRIDQVTKIQSSFVHSFIHRKKKLISHKTANTRETQSKIVYQTPLGKAVKGSY